MELFLNILWIAIALGAFAIWRLDWNRREPCSRHEPLQQWTAFACALVLLFFAVSLSDDLRAQALLTDEGARGRHQSLILANASSSRQHATVQPGLAAVLSAGAPPFAFVPASRLAPGKQMSCVCAARERVVTRGPPISQL